MTTRARTRVLVVGGGFAGVGAACEQVKLADPRASV
jgi:cation diffusion facilitator CzcD-associated flavoprotein CzcO